VPPEGSGHRHLAPSIIACQFGPLWSSSDSGSAQTPAKESALGRGAMSQFESAQSKQIKLFTRLSGLTA